MTTAQIISNQIGSRAFFMIGAKNLLDFGNALQFDVGRGPKSVTKARIELADDDTYTCTFYRGRGVNIREASKVEMVYADSLRQVIESNTGLYTSL